MKKQDVRKCIRHVPRQALRACNSIILNNSMSLEMFPGISFGKAVDICQILFLALRYLVLIYNAEIYLFCSSYLNPCHIVQMLGFLHDWYIHV